MSEQAPEYQWVEPKAQAEIDALLDALDLPPCQQCGAIVERHPDGRPVSETCYPCGVPGQKRANWYVGPTVRPRAAVFDWEGQAQRYATDLATLNARLVRFRGLLGACRAHVPPDLRRQLDWELDGSGQ